MARESAKAKRQRQVKARTQINKLKKQLNGVAKAYTKSIRDVIKSPHAHADGTSRPLIDTGKMLAEVATVLRIQKNGKSTVSIISTEYYKYVDGMFKIEASAKQSSTWKKATNKLIDILAQIAVLSTILPKSDRGVSVTIEQ